MKKQEKIETLQQGINKCLLCRCYFTYDDNYFYYYPHAVNERFMLGREEDDFSLDGYSIRKLSQLKKVELKNDKCNEINRMLGVTEQLMDPQIDIGSWQSIFEDLKGLNTYIIIENENNGQFAIGMIEKLLRNKVIFKRFDADGEWETDGIEIPFSQITSVTWNSRYIKGWKYYFENQKLNENV